MSIESFKELWYQSTSPTLWCEKFAHPLHRMCPVILDYENLPEPFKSIADEMEHEGETGERVHAKPETCYACEKFILNGGTCDPV